MSAPGPSPTSALPYTAGSTKYFGTAKARYDFCARDRSELSLKEGDIIKIINKKGQQGWWRGEIYGRVSWGELGSLGKGRGGDLVMVERPWNCGMEKVGSGSRGGLPGRTGGRDISFHRDFIHLCNLHLFIAFIFYAPGILLGAKETEKNPVQSLPS